MKIFDRGHVPEEALAELADDPAVRGRLTPSDRHHLDTCDRCRRLEEGHRRATQLLASTWQFVGSEQLAGNGTQQVRGRVTAGGTLGPFDLRRPLLVVVLVLLLVALVWTGIFIGSARPETKLPLAVPAVGPRCSQMDRVADAAGAVSGGAWAETASPAGAAADVRPGAIAGWTLGPEARDIVLLEPTAGTETRIPLQRRGRFIGGTSDLEWSPDGGALAIWWLQAEFPPYCSDLYVAAGGRLTRPAPSSLAEQTSSFAWAPDSSRLAAIRSETVAGGEHRLWLIPRDGGPILNLEGPCDDCILEYPRWSPDSSRIAINWIESDLAAGTQEWGLAFVDATTGIWSRRPATNVETIDWLDDDRLLVHGPGGLTIVSADDSAVGQVPDALAGLTASLGPSALAPDRARLAGTREPAGGGSGEVVIVDLITGNEHVVWSPDGLSTDGLSTYSELIWSPDGSSLAISVYDADLGGSAKVQGVWTVNTDGSGLRRIRSEPLLTMAWQPVWP